MATLFRVRIRVVSEIVSARLRGARYRVWLRTSSRVKNNDECRQQEVASKGQTEDEEVKRPRYGQV